MCRNIRTLYNYEPPATEDEVRSAALQYIRKISGFTKPSRANEEAFFEATEEIAATTLKLIDSLSTSAPAKNREIERKKSTARAAKRYTLLKR